MTVMLIVFFAVFSLNIIVFFWQISKSIVTDKYAIRTDNGMVIETCESIDIIINNEDEYNERD